MAVPKKKHVRRSIGKGLKQIMLTNRKVRHYTIRQNNTNQSKDSPLLYRNNNS